MKILLRILITCFLTIFGAIFLLQLPTTKRQIKQWIKSAAYERGIELEIERLDGNLPFEWTAKGVSCCYHSQEVRIGEVKMRLSLARLLKKQLDISYLKLEKGSYGGVPFEGHGRLQIDLCRQASITISDLLLEGDDLFVRLEGKVSRDVAACEGNLAFQVPNLRIFSPHLSSGLAMGVVQISPEKAHIDCFAEALHIANYPLTKSTLTIDAEKKGSFWEGQTHLASGHESIPLDSAFRFCISPEHPLISIDNLVINGPDMHSFGKLDFHPRSRSIEGTVYTQVLDMSHLSALFPQSYAKGRLGGKISFQSFASCQEVDCQLELEEIAFYDQFCKSLTVEAHLSDLFGNLRGELAIEGQGAFSQELALDHFEIKSTVDPHVSPFTFSLRGSWKEPLAIDGEGSWQKRDSGLFLNIGQLSGLTQSFPFCLREPFTAEWNRSHFKMSHFAMDVGKGSLMGRIDLSDTSSLIKLQATDFPLNVIPLKRSTHLSLRGVCDAHVDLIAWKHQLQGRCHIALKRALFQSEGAPSGLVTKGSIQIHLQNNRAQIFSAIKAKEDQFAHLNATIPILYSHFPLRVAIDPDKALCGQLTAEGKIEHLLNFINIGHHRIEGFASTRLNISKTWNAPYLQGEIYLQNGLYENYYTGTHLRQIDARAHVSKQTVHITSLSASDGNRGSAKATGRIRLSQADQFPFSIRAEIDNLDTVSFDTIVGKFSGDLTVSGSKLGSKAEGNLTVSEAIFRIPDRLPAALPQLPITFINPPEIIARNTISSPAVSPMQLDLTLDVPAKAFIEGRGMRSELQGKLHITGTYTDIVAKGTLGLIWGEYIFSGKVFDLTSGELIFQDKPTPSAYISLSGSCDLPDVSVTIALRGPLTSPKLSFNSSPQLSTSSLLSQILFNKDVSEINAAQALQLAQTVISLSGASGPDILEKIRKTLGIDRLTIVTSENDPGKISLQIGKYLMRGVLLTLSQGAESRNVSVEVDLKKGLRFQAEVDEHQQGKFSLKWHHHY